MVWQELKETLLTSELVFKPGVFRNECAFILECSVNARMNRGNTVQDKLLKEAGGEWLYAESHKQLDDSESKAPTRNTAKNSV